MGLLISRGIYLKAGVHKGSTKKTKYMKKFILKTAPTGLNFLNLRKVDERIRIAANFLSHKKEIVIFCKSREEEIFKKMASLIGAKLMTKYPAGFITNPQGKVFMEPEVALITDIKYFKNGVKELAEEGIPIVALCNTDSCPNNVDFIIPVNIRNKNALFLVAYLLTKEILRLRKEGELSMKDFKSVDSKEDSQSDQEDEEKSKN